MKTIFVNEGHIFVSENAHIVDFGEMENVTIEIGSNITAHYTILPHAGKKYRHIKVNSDSSFLGKGVIVEDNDITIVSEVVGDRVSAFLDILAIAKTDAQISVEGVVRVAQPYRKINTRVDQVNILIGERSVVRGVPKLEVATNDIEGGHSCKIHRLHGDVLFYLESHGLNADDAESLLLQSEIMSHTDTLPEDIRENSCSEIYKKLYSKK